MPTCNACHEYFPTWPDLARHIATAKKGHAKGKRFAANILTHNRSLSSKKDMPERSAMSDDEKAQVKEAKKETHRELSGENRLVMTICPKCKAASRQALPVEYVDSPYAWSSGSGALMICCTGCRR